MVFLNYCNLYLKTKSNDLLRLHQYSGQALRQTCFTRGSRGTTSGYYGGTDQWLWLTFSLHINQILWNWDLFHRVPLSQNDKDFSAPLFLLSALLALYCSIFLKGVLNSTSDLSVHFANNRIDKKVYFIVCENLKYNFEKCCQFLFCSNCHFEIQLFPISRLNCLHNEFEIGSI